MSLFGGGGCSAHPVETVKPSGEPRGLSLFRVRPFKDTPGIDAAVEFVRGVTTDERTSVEIWFHDARLQFVVAAPSRGAIADVVNSHFPNSVIETTDVTLPLVDAGYVAGARLTLDRDCAYPIRHPGSSQGFDTDPYKTVLPKLVGDDAESVCLQVAFEPVSSTWYRRGLIGAGADKIGESRGEGRVVGQFDPTVVQTQTDTAVKRDIQRQHARPAFATNVRVFASAPSADRAADRADSVAGIVADQYDHVSGQGFEFDPLGERGLRKGLGRAARRTVTRRPWVYRVLRGSGAILTDEELAGLAHLPDASINVPDVDWARMESGPGAPPDAPQFGGGG